MPYLSFSHWRFACKLSFAVVLSLFLGFHLQLETPRWSVLTAAIVAAGPAFAAGGEPFSGAIRHRGLLRIAGTVIGCIGALVIIIATIRAPVVMLLLCCIWAGVCTWISSLVKVEHAYVYGLAGYTALIIIVSTQGTPLLTPQFAVERCCEIVLGIVCAILADLLFAPRSIKQNIDSSLETLLVDHYRLLQLCVGGAAPEAIDAAWHGLVRKTTALEGMCSHLVLESARWQNSRQRIKALLAQSFALITHAYETYLALQDTDTPLRSSLKVLIDAPVDSVADVRQRMKLLRYAIAAEERRQMPSAVVGWASAATRYLLLMQGLYANARLTRGENELLREAILVKAPSAERHHAMINGWRTGVATGLGCLFWLLTRWSSGSVCMVMIAVVTALAMRLPNPRRMALDFLYGTLYALPLGAMMFMWIMPATQQSMLLLCLSLGGMAFVLGIEVQKRRLGSLGALASTINILVLDNPMTFDVSQFLDSAIGQVIGCMLAWLVIVLIRDNTRSHTGRTLLNRFVYRAVTASTGAQTKRRQNHLPALYQQLYLLLNMFPDDIARYRLALSLIIMHQRLRQLTIPADRLLAPLHRRLRDAAGRVGEARRDLPRLRAFAQLLATLDEYQEALRQRQAPDAAGAVGRLAAILRRYRRVLAESAAADHA